MLPSLAREPQPKERRKGGIKENEGQSGKSEEKQKVGKVGSALGYPTRQPNPQLGFLGLLVSPQPIERPFHHKMRASPLKNTQSFGSYSLQSPT